MCQFFPLSPNPSSNLFCPSCDGMSSYSTTVSKFAYHTLFVGTNLRVKTKKYRQYKNNIVPVGYKSLSVSFTHT